LSSGRFPSVLRFRLYQTVSVSDFLGAFQVSASAFPFPASPTLSDPFGPDFLGAFKFRAFALSFSAAPTLSEGLGRIYRRPFLNHQEGGFFAST
ncbi:hypothetical protein AB0912_25980, partial [Streptomyces sp. NPDC007084]|uniref:hypothetical protein n=1 Tax=Streptomyces sp. NPDC007084 TaxID=3154313 RepID=UPI003455B3B2